MPTNRDRQRAAARAKLEREMAERTAAAQRRRRTQAVVGGAAGVVVVIGLVVWLVLANTGGKSSNTAASPSGSAAASTPANCTWTAKTNPDASGSPQPLPSDVKDVGTPPASGEPRTGTQTMTITTNVGVIKAKIDLSKAPCTAESFTYLASKKFFDNTPCHRLTTSGLYVLQCGDPSGSGAGGPAYEYGEENLPTNRRPAYPTGTLAMANAGAGTNGSQFFIVYKDSDLPADYTILGKITEGLDVVTKVAEAGVAADPSADPSAGPAADGKPKTPVTIQSLVMSTPQA